ncbi:SNF7 family protein [Prunus dulcis]|uniref:SNF7 family protein n=1 Tax=Prunus dulcis TaxID=3755 RepID=A0A4Y1R116_PRUDU|nr:SNF7 family protein [Prunus dulcis]
MGNKKEINVAICVSKTLEGASQKKQFSTILVLSQKGMVTQLGENGAAIAWHESRKKWVGDQRMQRMAKDPIISWSTAYEDLLSTHDSFPEPIPLTTLKTRKGKRGEGQLVTRKGEVSVEGKEKIDAHAWIKLKSQAREHYCCSVFFIFLRIRKRENEGNKINELKKMNKVKSLLKPKPNPSEQLRDWQRRLRQECRNLERQIRGNALSISIKSKKRCFCFSDIQKEEKAVHKSIREAAKRNDMGTAKALAKEILMSRKAVNRLHENKAQLNSISMHLGESVALARTVGHLSKSAEVMKLVNNLMKAPEMAATMQEFTKEITKAGVIEEFVNDAVDSALDSEDIEEETEEEVEKVLSEIAGETAAQLPEAVRKERTKVAAQGASASQDEEAIAEGADDEEELEELRARLAQVRS